MLLHSPTSKKRRVLIFVDITLDGGVTYWLEVAPILDFASYGQTGWWPTTSLTGLPPVQIFEAVDPPVSEWTPIADDVAFCLQAGVPPPTGACCVDEVCVATNTEAQCAALTGTWHEGQTCPEFDCSLPDCYEYLPGDVNMAFGTWPPAALSGDVTYLVNFFRGIPTSNKCFMYNPLATTPDPGTCFWASADANGDCKVIGSDVTKLVNVFRGLTTMAYCADYVPCWPTPPDLPPTAPAGWPNCEVPCPPATVTGERVINTPDIGGK